MFVGRVADSERGQDNDCQPCSLGRADLRLFPWIGGQTVNLIQLAELGHDHDRKKKKGGHGHHGPTQKRLRRCLENGEQECEQQGCHQPGPHKSGPDQDQGGHPSLGKEGQEQRDIEKNHQGADRTGHDQSDPPQAPVRPRRGSAEQNPAPDQEQPGQESMDEHSGPHDLLEGLEVIQEVDLLQTPEGQGKEHGVEQGISAQPQDLASNPGLARLQDIVQTEAVLEGKNPQGEGQAKNEGLVFDSGTRFCCCNQSENTLLDKASSEKGLGCVNPCSRTPIHEPFAQ